MLIAGLANFAGYDRHAGSRRLGGASRFAGIVSTGRRRLPATALYPHDLVSARSDFYGDSG